jgi:hypothetical protein
MIFNGRTSELAKNNSFDVYKNVTKGVTKGKGNNFTSL